MATAQTDIWMYFMASSTLILCSMKYIEHTSEVSLNGIKKKKRPQSHDDCVRTVNVPVEQQKEDESRQIGL